MVATTRPALVTLVVALLSVQNAFLLGALAEATMPTAIAEATDKSSTTLEPLKLDQAVDTALGKNTLVKNAMLEARISKDRIAESRTHLFPIMKVQTIGAQLLTPLGFSFNRGSLGTIAGAGPIPDQNVSVTTDQRPFLFVNALIAQPIIQMGRIGMAVKQSKITQSIAEQKLQIQKQQITNQVRHAYYQALELRGTLNVIEATKTLYTEIARTTDKFLAEKTVLKADAIEVQQQLASIQYEATKTRNSLADRKEELNHLLGRDPNAELNLVEVSAPDALNMTIEEARSQALSGRAEIRQISGQVKNMDLERRMKRLQYLPDLSLIVDYLSVFGSQVLPKNVAVVGLFLNWEPYDWGRKHYEGAQKRKQLEQLQNSLKDMDTQITLEVNTAYRKWQECREYMTVADLGRQLSMERLRVVTNKYKEQAALLKDVLQAQRDVTKASNQYGQAALALWGARADFEKAIGQ